MTSPDDQTPTLDDILDNLAVHYFGYKATWTREEAKQQIEQLIADAETRMGDAIIERMRQSNYQWEKAESLIQSYQTQKVENVHNLKALRGGL